jgi:hypothetical protein
MEETAGQRRPRRRFPPSPTGTRRWSLPGSVRFPGRCSASGHWKREDTTIRTGCGAARCPAASSAPTTGALRGTWSLWDHPKRKEWFGGGAEFPGIHSISVDPGNSRRVTIGVSCGGVWVTEDHGGTWTCRADGMRAEYMPPDRQFDPFIQDPHRVVQCSGDPKSFWAAHHNGVFRSTDGARSWQEITAQPSSFGFAVAVHPRQPDTAWLVPAESDQRRIPFEGRVVVSRTRDGGKSFTVLSRGLPQQHAYDITYRHALDIDSTGDHLALGSTTGNLWVTVDQGDSWQTVAEHLPPVYAVRWVGGEAGRRVSG